MVNVQYMVHHVQLRSDCMNRIGEKRWCFCGVLSEARLTGRRSLAASTRMSNKIELLNEKGRKRGW